MRRLLPTLVALLAVAPAAPAFSQQTLEEIPEEIPEDEPESAEPSDTDSADSASQTPASTEGETEEEQISEEDRPSDPFEDFGDIGRDDFTRQGPNGGRPLELMTPDELAAAGFEFGARTSSADTSTALLLAITVGTGFHGIGHLYLGDRRTGLFLFGLEAASLALIGSSVVFFGVTEAASPGAAFFAPAFQLGLATFAFSYLLDVIGTLQSDVDLAPNTSASRGIGLIARYGIFDAVGFPVRHAIDGTLVFDIGGVWARAATTQDVFLDLASYRVRAGARPIRGASQLTFLSVQAGGDFLEWNGEGEFGRFSADGRIGASYQVGDTFPHLDQFALGAEIGGGARWYQFAPTGSTTFEHALTRPFVPFDVHASVNLSERLNVFGGYGTSELSWVPATQRLLGVAHVEFTYRSSSYGDISLKTEIGDGFALWLGGSFWLLR